MVLSFLFGRWRKELAQKIHNTHLTLHTAMTASFQNVRGDLGTVRTWVSHLHQKDKHHERRIEELESRLDSIETYLEELAQHHRPAQVTRQHPKQFSLFPQSSTTDATLWDGLTETQQQICWKLASLQKETPDKWISLKYLAQEMYPDKEYNQVRSALSQYISVLEDLGIVTRKRKGKHAFVLSTENNPCLKQPIPLEIKR